MDYMALYGIIQELEETLLVLTRSRPHASPCLMNYKTKVPETLLGCNNS
jgi:hypothetical protein